MEPDSLRERSAHGIPGAADVLDFTRPPAAPATTHAVVWPG
jgi:hypothetical protein